MALIQLLSRRRRHAERREFRLRTRNNVRAVEDDAQFDWFAGSDVNRLNTLAVVGMADEDLVRTDSRGNRPERRGSDTLAVNKHLRARCGVDVHDPRTET